MDPAAGEFFANGTEVEVSGGQIVRDACAGTEFGDIFRQIQGQHAGRCWSCAGSRERGHQACPTTGAAGGVRTVRRGGRLLDGMLECYGHHGRGHLCCPTSEHARTTFVWPFPVAPSLGVGRWSVAPCSSSEGLRSTSRSTCRPTPLVSGQHSPFKFNRPRGRLLQGTLKWSEEPGEGAKGSGSNYSSCSTCPVCCWQLQGWRFDRGVVRRRLVHWLGGEGTSPPQVRHVYTGSGCTCDEGAWRPEAVGLTMTCRLTVLISDGSIFNHEYLNYRSVMLAWLFLILSVLRTYLAVYFISDESLW